MDILRSIRGDRTPQNEAEHPDQRRNNAGGYTFVLDDAAPLRRFLTLGVDGGTFYTDDRTLAMENAAVVARMAEAQPELLVNTIVQISTSGRAPRQQPVLFALAYAASSPQSAPLALAALPQVARTGTHLFQFAAYVEQFRGWGRSLRRAVGDWYTTKDADRVAFQAVKYRQREGWSHRDLLRLAHPSTDLPSLKATFDWIARGSVSEHTPRLIEGFLRAAEPDAPWADLITEYGLTWEMLPDAALAQPTTWEALLAGGMPQTALLRQLPRLTRLGLLAPGSDRTEAVVAQLADPERFRAARVHPVNVLVAQRTYASGRSARGESTWEPVQVIADALDDAFYRAFGVVEPSGTRTLLAVDVSGSMEQNISGLPLTAREASAALALVQLATEPGATAVGFSGAWRKPALDPLQISPRQRLDDALRVIEAMPMGGTDCSLPMRHALKQRMKVDTFVVYTDDETWFGDIHPFQALREYRQAMGIPARLIVVGMTATQFSIADPQDPGMLNVVGFDAAVPQLISDFARGL